MLNMMLEHPSRGQVIDTSTTAPLVNNVSVAMLVLYNNELSPTWTVIDNFGVFVNVELCRHEVSAINYFAGIAGALGYPAGFVNPNTVVPFMRSTLTEMNFFQRELVKMTSSLGHRSLSGELSHLFSSRVLLYNYSNTSSIVLINVHVHVASQYSTSTVCTHVYWHTS